MVVFNQLRRGFFLDSVALMRISREIAACSGIEEAALMMGTPANLAIMEEASLLEAAGREAGGGDLVIALRGETQAAVDGALAAAAAALDAPKTGAGAAVAWNPRSMRAAVKAVPEANLALISVPGAFAAAEARKALNRGLHAMIFSDNVSLEDERALKTLGAERGLLVMGPDCGTAIIGGVPLAFANQVPQGSIGLIGASGTGLQEVSCLIAQGGGGISQAIGVGGRDLKEEIGGVTTLMALQALQEDPATDRIVIISKPPAPTVVEKLLTQAGTSDKPLVLCLIGGQAPDLPSHMRFAATLKEAAALALEGANNATPQSNPTPVKARPGRVAGLFAGGTLAAETQVIFLAKGQAVASNAPIPGAQPLTDQGDGHSLIDLGEDEYTQGRPHPMIDPAVRDAPFAAALADPTVGVVLLDLVIGWGAAPDPAGHLATALADRAHDGPVVIASVTGTDADPQGRQAQIAALEAVGVLVAPSNADAAVLALACLSSEA